MDAGVIVAIVVVAIIIVLVVALVGVYNSLVQLNERVSEAWSDITVQLKYRADLIPNVVETVKAYAKHEKETFQNVTEARSQVMGAKTVEETAQAERAMTTALGKMLAVAESYPELKASTGFQELQTQLQDTEEKIQAARRFYNAGAKALNTRLKTFPINLVNGLFGHFEPREYFEVSEEEEEKIEKAPEVKF